MALETHTGSCHCGAVRFHVELDLAAGTNRCNCSLCAKARAWFAFAKGADRFHLDQGADALTEYRWKPPARAEPFLTYAFCKTCGIRVFARGELEALGGVFHAVPVNVLDDVDVDELASAPIRRVDGLHDRFEAAPEDVRLM